MTTTGTFPITPPAAPPPIRRLRRSRTDRIGAGVSGGLGEYFGVDPVLFRVLFATAAFFGGAGVLAYLLAWLAIPEQGTERAAIDGWVRSLRRRRVPFWVIVILGSVLFWIVAFSWWAPGPFFPVIAVIILLVVVFGRRRSRPEGGTVSLQKDGTVSLQKDATVSLQKDTTVSLQKDTIGDEGRPEWARETRRWLSESREASRARARRAFPVKMTTLLVLVGTLVTLALIDSARGLALPVYLWFALGIVGAGLLTGMALRRTPWSISVLLIAAVVGLIAFAGTRASLHDGVGQREWTPVTAPDSHYRLAFGKAILDLRALHAQDVARVVRIDQAAGQLRIIAPRSMDLTVLAHVHIGVVTLDGEPANDGDAGFSVSRTVEPLSGATGRPITIDVHLADGNVDIVRT